MVTYSDPLTEALRRYAAFTDAEVAIVSGQQAYSVAGRSLTRGNLKEIRDTIEYLDKRIGVLRARAARGGIRIRGAVPLP
jgi:Family of unknown function (DUF6148)